MQATVEITEQEYEILESHIKRAILMDKAEFKLLTICDKILGRLYLALEMQGASKDVSKQPRSGQ